MQLSTEVDLTLRSGGFELRKWTSNNSGVVSSLSAMATHMLDRTEDAETSVCAGLRWMVRSESFRVRLEQGTKTTKRAILSSTARLYDPTGLIGPTIIIAKIIIQNLWRLGLAWDDELPQPVLRQWQEFRQQLPCLERLQIPRRLQISKVHQIQSHGFANASSKAYMRTVSEIGIINCQLLPSKSRVASLKTVSIRRMELAAAELISRLLEAV